MKSLIRRYCALGMLGAATGLAFGPMALRRSNPGVKISTEPLAVGAPVGRSKCPFAKVTRFFGLKKPKNHVGQDTLPLSTVKYNTTTTAMSTSAIIPNNALTPLESWCVMQLEKSYNEALALKCPFFRRRASDILDSVDSVIRVLIIRNRSLLGPPPSLRCAGKTCDKDFGLSIKETMEIIRKDWRQDTKKGYYVTGRLTTSIYRDDCLFDGPDPDMPVKGLRKFLNAAKQLFDQRSSSAELLSLAIEGDVVKANWKFNGILRLPWRPTLPEVTGTTTYHMDPTGLIYLHEETWNMSAVQAFFKTMLPALSRRIGL